MSNKKQPDQRDVVDENAEDSFPASDPPSFTPETQVGDHDRDKEETDANKRDPSKDKGKTADFRQSVAGEEDPGAAIEDVVDPDADPKKG